MKAFLTSKAIPFPRTHDLLELLLTKRADASFELIKDLLSFLGQYSVRFRYPGDEADAREAKKAFQSLEEIKKFFKGRIL